MKQNRRRQDKKRLRSWIYAAAIVVLSNIAVIAAAVWLLAGGK